MDEEEAFLFDKYGDDWSRISTLMYLSESFIHEFQDKIFIDELILNQNSYHFESYILKHKEHYLNQTKILKYNIYYDLTHHSPEFIDLLLKLCKYRRLFLYDITKNIKMFQMAKCRWCPIARKWFHKTRFNWDRYRHYIECWRSNPRFSYVQRKLAKEFDEYSMGLQKFKAK